MRDTRDLVIDELADSEAELYERVVSLEADRDSYRMLAQEAIHAVHHLTRQRDRLREQYARLADEYRTLRAKLLRQEAA